MITFPQAAFSGSKRSEAAAFTLLELLVVISIIAVLAGILLPVTSSVMENAKKTEAKSTSMQILTAVKSFQTDYGVYPAVPNVTTASHDTLVDGSTNDGLFNILRSLETGATIVNTRRVVYFEGKDVKNTKVPKSGFIPSGSTATSAVGSVALKSGALVDPWGNGFLVRYDSGYTDAVLNPYANIGAAADDDSATPNTSLRFGAIAWSWGKDGQKGAKGTMSGTAPTYTMSGNDDVVSWQ